MMATTHAFAGLALASVVAVLAPALGPAAAAGALVGGTLPDLDVLHRHRRTLHYPVYYGVAAMPATALAVIAPTAATVFVALFLLAAWLHSVTDVLGGDLTLRPWEARGSRGVFVHPTGTWVQPRRLIRYDGAPEDMALATALAIPGLLTFDGTIRAIVLVGLTLSLVYVVARKRVVEWVPERFL